MSPLLASSVDLEPVEQVRSLLVDRIEKGELRLPLLPQVAHQVMTLTNDPDSDVTRLASLIQQDQALAGQILSVANSPAYMPRSPIVSLQQAVAWLGMKHLADMALMVSIQSGVFRVQGFEAEVKALWRHALATGLFGKEIARLGRHNVENAFLCGLLHAVGKPVILHNVIEIQKLQDLHLPWNSIGDFMEEFHVSVGNLLTENWKLPDQVKEAITYYKDHTYKHAPSPTKVALITCLADHLASYLLEPTLMDEETLLALPVIQDLNLYSEDVSSLLEQGETILKTLDSMPL